jgi:hypothetical protein
VRTNRLLPGRNCHSRALYSARSQSPASGRRSPCSLSLGLRLRAGLPQLTVAGIEHWNRYYVLSRTGAVGAFFLVELIPSSRAMSPE